eukprot:6843163-Pyramimonas_sp.AAC.1
MASPYVYRSSNVVAASSLLSVDVSAFTACLQTTSRAHSKSPAAKSHAHAEARSPGKGRRRIDKGWDVTRPCACVGRGTCSCTLEKSFVQLQSHIY